MGIVRAIVKWISHHRILSAFVVLIVVGVGVFFRIQFIRSQGSVSDPLVRGTILKSVYGIGTVTANNSYQLKPGVIGTIDYIYIKEGDAVKKGDKLLRIDSVIYRAPFNGTVTNFDNKIGENIFSNVPTLTLVDLIDRYVLVSLEQQGALRVKRGQKVKLSFDTLRESNFDGEVESIYSSDTNFLARIDIPNLPPRILPGMTADVAITIDIHATKVL